MLSDDNVLNLLQNDEGDELVLEKYLKERNARLMMSKIIIG